MRVEPPEEPIAVFDRYPAFGSARAWPRGAMYRGFSTANTVAEIERQAKGDQWKPRVRALATPAYQAGGGRNDELGAVLAIERAVHAAVAFVPDPLNVERIVSPERLLGEEAPAGDCDDLQALLASALLSVGFDPRIVRLAWTLEAQDPYEHVCVQVPVRHDGEEVLVVLDPTYSGHLGRLLASAARSYVHRPVGRPEVRPAGW